MFCFFFKFFLQKRPFYSRPNAVYLVYRSSGFSTCAMASSTSGTRSSFSTQSVSPNEPVVSVDWLHANIREPDLKVLDASWYMPDEQRNPLQEYQVAHIPGALFFDVDGISDQTTNLPHMLPSEEAFAAAVSALGIENKDGVVVYDGKGIFSAARVWWMFRVFGHERIWVLDGGLPTWRASGFDVESSASGDAILKASAASEAIEKVYRRQAVSFMTSNGCREHSFQFEKLKGSRSSVGFPRGHIGSSMKEAKVGPITFQTRFQPHLVWTLEQVNQNIENKTHQHIDARSKARFDGIAPEPRKGIRSGHVPSSKCIPFSQMLDSSQKLLPADELKKRFDQEGKNSLSSLSLSLSL
ncbi:Thiosulfate/3-mercaptopyruvate sulfurtransferase 1, mitochondrial [Vitis vinifera]|uniref:3-mercaptopyruvate sulfurtransferase n=1 Tax=Vitis vinifera TaxID=29760 RepID=A0A438CLD2_VITVI|nr:Thiosulfate/3-mercaptopyruvate sulfurtransferase 1, mitochondrial [Vitis vinifera]